jgi:hypothetical protein
MLASPGNANFAADFWHNDQLEETNHDDALWGYVVRAAEEYRTRNVEQWDDPVLNRLYRMGAYDWVAPDHHTMQGTQAICYALALSLRLWARIRGIESQVRRSRF